MDDRMAAMAEWKDIMKGYAGMEPYTDEWWDKMASALVFLPEEGRAGFVMGIVGAGLGW